MLEIQRINNFVFGRPRSFYSRRRQSWCQEGTDALAQKVIEKLIAKARPIQSLTIVMWPYKSWSSKLDLQEINDCDKAEEFRQGRQGGLSTGNHQDHVGRPPDRRRI